MFQRVVFLFLQKTFFVLLLFWFPGKEVFVQPEPYNKKIIVEEMQRAEPKV